MLERFRVYGQELAARADHAVVVAILFVGANQAGVKRRRIFRVREADVQQIEQLRGAGPMEICHRRLVFAFVLPLRRRSIKH